VAGHVLYSTTHRSTVTSACQRDMVITVDGNLIPDPATCCNLCSEQETNVQLSCHASLSIGHNYMGICPTICPLALGCRQGLGLVYMAVIHHHNPATARRCANSRRAYFCSGSRSGLLIRLVVSSKTSCTACRKSVALLLPSNALRQETGNGQLLGIINSLAEVLHLLMSVLYIFLPQVRARAIGGWHCMHVPETTAYQDDPQ
jgi:hypothetical protein